MKGLMQDQPLTIQRVLWRTERLFSRKVIATRRESSVHRYSYTDMSRRVHRVANALRRLGVRPGDRVATLAWNNYRHLELYYAVPCMGAVLHTLNLRLFPDQLAHVIADAEDKVIIVDKTLVPILDKVAGRIPSVRSIVAMNDGGPLPDHSLGEVADYEALLAAESDEFPWPAIDEGDAAGMCYTSGTTGHPKGPCTPIVPSSCTRWASCKPTASRSRSASRSFPWSRCSMPARGGCHTPAACPGPRSSCRTASWVTVRRSSTSRSPRRRRCSPEYRRSG